MAYLLGVSVWYRGLWRENKCVLKSAKTCIINLLISLCILFFWWVLVKTITLVFGVAVVSVT
jgi:hypothetical protein